VSSGPHAARRVRNVAGRPASDARQSNWAAPEEQANEGRDAGTRHTRAGHTLTAARVSPEQSSGASSSSFSSSSSGPKFARRHYGPLKAPNGAPLGAQRPPATRSPAPESRTQSEAGRTQSRAVQAPPRARSPASSAQAAACGKPAGRSCGLEQRKPKTSFLCSPNRKCARQFRP